MKQEVKLKIILMCLLAVALVIGVVLAFYGSQGDIENVLSTKSSSVYIQELFDPADYWLAGETKQKEVKFGNQGERDQIIRFRIEEKWYASNGTTWKPKTPNPVEIKWSEEIGAQWTSFEDDNGWYYYKDILEVGEQTDLVMKGLKFANRLSNDKQIEDFSYCSFRLVIYMEALDVNPEFSQSSWSKTFIQEEGLRWSIY